MRQCPPSILCVLQQQRGFEAGRETAGVVRRAARYATQRGATTSATQFVDERRTVCSRRVSLLSLSIASFRRKVDNSR